MVGGDYRWTDKSVSSLGFVFELIPQNSFDTGKIESSSKMTCLEIIFWIIIVNMMMTYTCIK